MLLSKATADEVIDSLVRPIARAVKDDRVTTLAATLARLEATGTLANPVLFAAPETGRYARRTLWQDVDGKFVVVAITWAPGQSSALHDHDGLWGAEIVVGGTMRETAFQLVDRDRAGRYRFLRGASRDARKGTVGTLNPPLEYHEFGNAGPTTAHSIHVYGGTLDRCRAFTADTDGWWNANQVDLRRHG